MTYRARIYGGTNFDTPIPSDWRDYLYSVFLHALRDVKGEIRAWRRSPLRTLLLAASAALAEQDLSVPDGATGVPTAGRGAADAAVPEQGAIWARRLPDACQRATWPGSGARGRVAAAAARAVVTGGSGRGR